MMPEPQQDHLPAGATNQLLADILDELKKQNRPTGALWSVADIAAFTGYAISTTQSTIITSKDFPRPRIMPGNGKRWDQAEVRAWVHKRNRG